MAPEKKSVVVIVKEKMSIVNRLENSESGEKKASKKNPEFPNFLHIRMDRRPN